MANSLKLLQRAAGGVLGLRPGEGAPTAIAAAYQVAFVASVAVIKSAAFALVLARLPVSALPLLYIGGAALTGLVAAVAGAARRRGGGGMPTGGLLVTAAACLLIYGAAQRGGGGPAAAALYLLGEVYATAATLRFWSSASEIFDSRQAKRVFGVLGGFGMAGAIVGGALAGAGWFSAAALAPLGAGLLVVAALLAGVLDRHRSRRASPSKRPSGALAYVFTEPLPSRLMAIAALMALTTVVVDYAFRIQARAALGEDQLAALYGTLNMVVGAGAAVFQLFLTGRLLSRFGVFRYLLVAPAAIALCGLGAFVSPGLATFYALKTVETAASWSITPTAMNLLYAPMPEELKNAARGMVDGLAKKVGFAAGGALLLVVGGLVDARALALAAAVLGAACGAISWLVRKPYVQAVEERIRHAPREAATLRLTDATARAVMARALTAGSEMQALVALEMLARDEARDLGALLAELLAHPSARVRARAAQLARERRALEGGIVEKLERMLGDPERRPRDEALRALAALRPREAPARLRPLLASADTGLRCAAIEALLLLPEPDPAAAAALDKLLARGPAAPAAERREIARLLGSLGQLRWTTRLRGLLHDPDLSVVKLACASAGQVRRPELIAPLFELLGSRGLRREARQALAAYGDAVAGECERVLNDREAPIEQRYEVPRLLRYIGTERAARILLFSNIQDDAFLRYRIALALYRLRTAHSDVPIDQARVHEAVLRRVDAYLYYLPIWRDLSRALPPQAILLRALGDRLDQNFEIVFRLLALVVDARTVMNLHHRITAGRVEERAFAAELLENLLPEAAAARVVPIVERWHRLALDESDVERAPARLLELIVSRDTVLRACAIATARKMAGAIPFSIPTEGRVSEEVIEKVFYLEGVDLFGHSSVDDLAAIAGIAYEQRWKAGEVIFREGTPGDSLRVIIEGKVRVEKQGRLVLTLGPKESFGETSFIDGKPRALDAVAETDVVTLVVDRQDFMDLVSDRVELLKGLFTTLSKHLRDVLEFAAREKAPEGAPPATLRAR